MERHMNVTSKLNRQRGTTLVISLIILLVMSLIGIANMQSTTMQERMASNTKQKSVAKFAAESALKVAEDWLDTNVKRSSHVLQFNGSNGLYSALDVSATVSKAPVTADISDLGKASAWSNTTAHSGSAIINTDIVGRQPQYVIEYIGRDYRGTANKVIGTDDLSKVAESSFSKPFFFRITAIGWGKDDNIYTVLESIYKTGSGDFFNY